MYLYVNIYNHISKFRHILTKLNSTRTTTILIFLPIFAKSRWYRHVHFIFTQIKYAKNIWVQFMKKFRNLFQHYFSPAPKHITLSNSSSLLLIFLLFDSLRPNLSLNSIQVIVSKCVQNVPMYHPRSNIFTNHAMKKSLIFVIKFFNEWKHRP